MPKRRLAAFLTFFGPEIESKQFFARFDLSMITTRWGERENVCLASLFLFWEIDGNRFMNAEEENWSVLTSQLTLIAFFVATPSELVRGR